MGTHCVCWRRQLLFLRNPRNEFYTTQCLQQTTLSLFGEVCHIPDVPPPHTLTVPIFLPVWKILRFGFSKLCRNSGSLNFFSTALPLSQLVTSPISCVLYSLWLILDATFQHWPMGYLHQLAHLATKWSTEYQYQRQTQIGFFLFTVDMSYSLIKKCRG